MFSVTSFGIKVLVFKQFAFRIVVCAGNVTHAASRMSIRIAVVLLLRTRYQRFSYLHNKQKNRTEIEREKKQNIEKQNFLCSNPPAPF